MENLAKYARLANRFFHITKICKNADQKLNDLARKSPYTAIEEWRAIMKAFIVSHFDYCSLFGYCIAEVSITKSILFIKGL